MIKNEEKPTKNLKSTADFGVLSRSRYIYDTTPAPKPQDPKQNSWLLNISYSFRNVVTSYFILIFTWIYVKLYAKSLSVSCQSLCLHIFWDWVAIWNFFSESKYKRLFQVILLWIKNYLPVLALYFNNCMTIHQTTPI